MKKYFNIVVSIPKLFWGVRNFIEVLIYFSKNQTGGVTLFMRNGIILKVNSLMDVWITKEVCLDHDYEKNSVVIQNGWTVIDIGAAFGDFTILTGKQNDKGKIYAFEPNPNYFKLLQENIKLNKMVNIRCFPKAVGKTNGTLQLDVTAKNAVDFTTSNNQSNKGIKVKSRNLETIFKDENIKCCDYLKIDCEGGEFDILFNTPKYLLKRIRNICLEYHDGITKYRGDDLTKYLSNNGYKVKINPNEFHPDIGYIFAKLLP